MITSRAEILNILITACPQCGAFEGEIILYKSPRWGAYVSCKFCQFDLDAQQNPAGDFRLKLTAPWRIGDRIHPG